MLMNIFDAAKDNLYYVLDNLKNIENNTLYWLRVDGIGQAKHDLYPLIPFYGSREQILWYNFLVMDQKGVIEVKIFQAITNIRFLTYDYDFHEGKTLTFDQFDAVDVRPNSQRSKKLYNSSLGAFTQPINPSDFKSLKYPRDVVLLYQGKPVFTLNEVEDDEKLFNVIQGLKNRLSEANNRGTTTTNAMETTNTIKDNKLSVKCSHCDRTVTMGSKFCNYCGTRMTPICSKCSHENPVGSEFCSNCGFILN